MNYKKLGNTDLDVSTICLGTMTWGEQNTQTEGFEQMDFALDKGVNFWDTAEIYSIPPREETFGSTEKIIGNWFEQTKKRDKVILASKVCGPMREYVRGGGNQFGKKNITAALEGSLRRLKTDYIDLYQLHWPERNTNFFGKLGYEHSEDEEWTKFEDILENLKKFIEQGKIRYVGLSNETPWGLSKFLEISKNIDSIGIRRNYFGRPIWNGWEDKDHILINNYIQSSAVDIALTYFTELTKEVNTNLSVPLYILHDAIIFDVSDDYYHNFVNIIKKGYNNSTLGKFPLKIEIFNHIDRGE